MFKKVIKIFKKLFGFGKDISEAIKKNVDTEDIRKVLAITGLIVKGVRIGVEFVDKNPQVDSKIEKALKVASMKLKLIDGREVNTVGDLVADCIKTIKGYPQEGQNSVAFMLAKTTAKHLFPNAKESHLDVLISGMIVVMKK